MATVIPIDDAIQLLQADSGEMYGSTDSEIDSSDDEPAHVERDGNVQSTGNLIWQWFYLICGIATTLLSLGCLISYFIRDDVDTSAYLIGKDKWMISMIVLMASMTCLQVLFFYQWSRKNWLRKNHADHYHHAEKVLCQLFKLLLPLIIAYELSVIFTSWQMTEEAIILAENCTAKIMTNTTIVGQCVECSHINSIQVSQYSTLNIFLAIAILLNNVVQLSLLLYILETACSRIGSNNQVIRGFAICMALSNTSLWILALLNNYFLSDCIYEWIFGSGWTVSSLIFRAAIVANRILAAEAWIAIAIRMQTSWQVHGRLVQFFTSCKLLFYPCSRIFNGMMEYTAVMWYDCGAYIQQWWQNEGNNGIILPTIASTIGLAVGILWPTLQVLAYTEQLTVFRSSVYYLFRSIINVIFSLLVLFLSLVLSRNEHNLPHGLLVGMKITSSTLFLLGSLLFDICLIVCSSNGYVIADNITSMLLHICYYIFLLALHRGYHFQLNISPQQARYRLIMSLVVGLSAALFIVSIIDEAMSPIIHSIEHANSNWSYVLMITAPLNVDFAFRLLTECIEFRVLADEHTHQA